MSADGLQLGGDVSLSGFEFGDTMFPTVPLDPHDDEMDGLDVPPFVVSLDEHRRRVTDAEAEVTAEETTIADIKQRLGKLMATAQEITMVIFQDSFERMEEPNAAHPRQGELDAVKQDSLRAKRDLQAHETMLTEARKKLQESRDALSHFEEEERKRVAAAAEVAAAKARAAEELKRSVDRLNQGKVARSVSLTKHASKHAFKRAAVDGEVVDNDDDDEEDEQEPEPAQEQEQEQEQEVDRREESTRKSSDAKPKRKKRPVPSTSAAVYGDVQRRLVSFEERIKGLLDELDGLKTYVASKESEAVAAAAAAASAAAAAEANKAVKRRKKRADEAGVATGVDEDAHGAEPKENGDTDAPKRKKVKAKKDKASAEAASPVGDVGNANVTDEETSKPDEKKPKRQVRKKDEDHVLDVLQAAPAKRGCHGNAKPDYGAIINDIKANLEDKTRIVPPNACCLCSKLQQATPLCYKHTRSTMLGVGACCQASPSHMYHVTCEMVYRYINVCKRQTEHDPETCTCPMPDTGLACPMCPSEFSPVCYILATGLRLGVHPEYFPKMDDVNARVKQTIGTQDFVETEECCVCHGKLRDESLAAAAYGLKKTVPEASKTTNVSFGCAKCGGSWAHMNCFALYFGTQSKCPKCKHASPT